MSNQLERLNTFTEGADLTSDTSPSTCLDVITNHDDNGLEVFLTVRVGEEVWASGKPYRVKGFLKNHNLILSPVGLNSFVKFIELRPEGIDEPELIEINNYAHSDGLCTFQLASL